MPHNIVIGQKVKSELVERARELRRQMTAEERILWQHLRANQLGGLHFRRQQVIEAYIVDFYCPAAALVVEVDGPIHEFQIERDKGRDDKLSGRGLLVVRFKNERIQNDLQNILKEILAACRGRMATPLPSQGRGQGLGL
jgi:very-short-patch-repair endonuclease